LGVLGLPVERLVLRLAMTLEYAELLLEQKLGFKQVLREIMLPNTPTRVKESLFLTSPTAWQHRLLGLQMVVVALTILIGNWVLWN
jgi:hypothetical protein